MKAKEFIKRVNKCSIWWSNIENRYVITYKGKQLYDTSDLDGAIESAKSIILYSL